PDETSRRYAYWPEPGKPELYEAARRMVLAFGLDHIIVQNFRAPSTSVTITRYTESLGKPAIAVEAGHAGTVHGEDVDVLVAGVWSVMRHHKMLAGAPSPVEHPVWIARYTGVASEHDGIFYPLALPEAWVQKGMPIGYITDYFGNKLADVVSPVNGVILYIGAVPSMKKGDNIANIGEVQ